jgi:hypothetical protein
MNYFLTKIFIIIFLALIIPLILLFGIPPLIAPKNNLPDNFVESFKKSEIIIAGDSRADRQIDPSIIYVKTKLNTINISSTGWDIYALSKTLLCAQIENKILIISASFFQINDGSIDNGYFSLDAFIDLNLFEKISLYQKRFNELFFLQFSLFKNSTTSGGQINNFGNYKRKVNVEFDAQQCELFEISNSWFDNHPWYKKPKTTGIKKKLLLKALDNLQKLKHCKILIYNGPVSNEFIKNGEKKGILKLENEYNDFMSSVCKKRGIAFHSFLGDTSLMNSNLYQDPQHLCKNGVPLFSNKIAEMLFELNYVK